MATPQELLKNEYFVCFEAGVSVGLAFLAWCWFLLGGFPVFVGILAVFKTIMATITYRKVSYRFE